MSAPLLVDVDLRDPDCPVPRTERPLRALLWWGDRVLGERILPATDTGWAEMRQELLLPLEPIITALDAVRPDGEPAYPLPGQVTVVVCTRDRPVMLAGCLEALRDLDPAPAEVVVVDNAPTDARTAEVVERFGFRHVVEPRAGLSHARNTGWSSAGTPVVAFTDDDARPHPRWVGALCRGFVTEAVTCVTGLVAAAELVTPAQQVFEGNGGMGKGFQPQLFSAGDVGVQGFRLGAGANMAFTRAVLEEIGGFDVRLGAGRRTRGGDDLDVFVRALAGGGVGAYQPDAVVRHVHRRDLPGLLRQYRDNGTGYAAVLQKYRSEGGPRGAVAERELSRWHRQRHVRSLLGAVRRREPARFLEIAAEALGSRSGAAAFEAEAALPSGGDRDR
ncbi:glycosyltransferase [Geodermatophilus sp. SYSU D00705]